MSIFSTKPGGAARRRLAVISRPIPPVSAPRTAAAQAPLADAAQRGDAGAVRALPARNADPGARQGDGAAALHRAAYRGDADSAAALISGSGCRVD